MSTIVCGDLHGLLPIAKELLQDKNQEVVFVGDFVDSFDKNINEQIELLDLVLDAIADRDNVSALLGNHEYGYLNTRYMCSGYELAMQEAVNARRTKLLVHFEWFKVVEDFVVTHAGVSQKWLESHGLKKHEAMDLFDVTNYLDGTDQDTLAEIGWERGGHSSTGGILWCDTTEFYPIPGVNQVFGHSAWRNRNEPDGIWEVYPGNFNIDCLPRVREVLEIAGSNATIRAL